MPDHVLDHAATSVRTARNRAATSQAVAGLLPRLHHLLGGTDRVMTSHSVREHRSRGEGPPDAAVPDAVEFPASNEEAAAVARLCCAGRVPIIPFGTGTSREGHVAAIHGGIGVDLSRMNAILQVSAEALDCRVQAGTTREQLSRPALRPGQECDGDGRVCPDLRAGRLHPGDGGRHRQQRLGRIADRARGDGNFHLGTLFDPVDSKKRGAAEALAYRTGDRALRLGGTCSGERGIRLHKPDRAAARHGG